jgi:hypothetical protein
MASLVHCLDEDNTPLPVLELPVHDTPSLANRRSLPRVSGRFEVRLHDDDTTLRGLDLSFGGLMCATEAPVWPGNLVRFDLCLPGEARPLALAGRVAELVCHRGELAMRIRFEDASESARKRIATWMAKSRGV